MQIESLYWQRLQTQWGLHLNHGPTRFAHVEQFVYFDAGRRFLPFGITAISIWFGDYFESFDSRGFYYAKHNTCIYINSFMPLRNRFHCGASECDTSQLWSTAIWWHTDRHDFGHRRW